MTIADGLTIIATAIFSLGGGGAIVIALSSWLGRVWAGRILEQDRAKYQQALETELERVRGDREKSVFVHRIQFEAEFRAYQEVWDGLSNCVASTLSLRPMFDNVPAGKTEEEIRSDRLGKFYSDFNSLVKVIRKHKPFLANSLDVPLNEMLRALHAEAIDYHHCSAKRDMDQDYWERQKQNSEDIQHRAENICGLIRERIGLLVVIENTS